LSSQGNVQALNSHTAGTIVSVCVGCIIVLISDRRMNANLMKRGIQKEETDKEKTGRQRSTRKR